ncbi:helix-turn-helix domain-containing protein [Nonomuraea spiralis]|uniref:AraC-like ligand-binding domain-containing protein n=1 Tax=Nonomuraea TaxID=83681 RepID=UPI00163CD845|nr:helix-turn-helix domain-containing protein [Nonomuraea sp. WAC 01424]
MTDGVDAECDHSYRSSWIHRTVRPSPVVTVSTDPIPRKDRLEWWAHLAAHEIAPTSLSSDHADDFYGQVHSVDLSRVRLGEFTMSPLKGWRTPAHISRHDPEGYELFLVHDTPIRLQQRRNDSWLQAGDISLFDTSFPYATEFLDIGSLTRLTLLFLPRDAVPLPRGQVERLLATRLPARTGSGAMLARYLIGLREHAAECHPTELPRLGTIALDLVTAFLAGRLDAEQAVPSDSRHRMLAAQIDAFITQHLGDPELTPSNIAAHHHISVRTLHVLFEQRPETVSAAIRRRRLERCQTDLADPRLKDRPIGEIGVRWGFRNGAEFSRAFRTTYGISPRDHRRQALSAHQLSPPPGQPPARSR